MFFFFTPRYNELKEWKLKYKNIKNSCYAECREISEGKGHKGSSNTALGRGKVYHDSIYWARAQFLNLSSQISRKDWEHYTLILQCDLFFFFF